MVGVPSEGSTRGHVCTVISLPAVCIYLASREVREDRNTKTGVGVRIGHIERRRFG